MQRVKTTTPARLHFGLIDLSGALGRIDDGIGIAINDPTFEIIAQHARRVLHIRDGLIEKDERRDGKSGNSEVEE